MTQQIIPQKSPELREFESLYKIWKLDHDAALPEFKIENIRFEHKSGWDKRFFSIQSAHSGNHWIWKATRIVWVSMSWPV
jgi:hypothetical protein